LIFYRNPLGKQMAGYVEALEQAEKDTSGIKCVFKELDACIPAGCAPEDALSPQIVFAWDSGLACSSITRKRKYSQLRGFAKYLWGSGINCAMPMSIGKASSAYVPCIFSDSELQRLILAADMLEPEAWGESGMDLAAAFPMALRVLFFAGLRANEALSLKTGDLDFAGGCLSVRKAKRKRQRTVPLKPSATDMLRKYCATKGILASTESLLFPGKDGKPLSDAWFLKWFSAALEAAGIQQNRSRPGERGICPHCLRHTFAFRAFHAMKAPFEETGPCLSTCMGHESVMETDRRLQFSYELHEEAHEKISGCTSGMFPKVEP
jgi:integrase